MTSMTIIHFSSCDLTGSCWQDMNAIWEVHAAAIKAGKIGIIENWYNLQNGPGRVLLKFQVFEMTEKIPKQLSLQDRCQQIPGLLSVFLGKMEADFRCKVQLYLTLEKRNDEGKKEVEEYSTPEPAFKKASKKHNLYINQFFVIDNIYSKDNKLIVRLWDTKKQHCIGKSEYMVNDLLSCDSLEGKQFSKIPNVFLGKEQGGELLETDGFLNDDDILGWAGTEIPITEMNNPDDSDQPPVRMQMQLTVHALKCPD